MLVYLAWRVREARGAPRSSRPRVACCSWPRAPRSASSCCPRSGQHRWSRTSRCTRPPARRRTPEGRRRGRTGPRALSGRACRAARPTCGILACPTGWSRPSCALGCRRPGRTASCCSPARRRTRPTSAGELSYGVRGEAAVATFSRLDRGVRGLSGAGVVARGTGEAQQATAGVSALAQRRGSPQHCTRLSTRSRVEGRSGSPVVATSSSAAS